MNRRFSISYKWALTLIVLILSLLVIGLVINKLFFYDYYLSQEKNQMYDFATELDHHYDDSESALRIINNFALKKQASVNIFSETEDFNFSFSAFSDSRFRGNGNGMKRRSNLPHGVNIDLTRTGYLFFELDHDDITTQLLSLVYSLKNGDTLLVTIPYENINKTADIAIQFNVYIVLILLLVGVIIVLFMARRMTKPIIALSDMTKKIAELDFTEQYKGKGNDEIHELGENINSMSSSLKGALGDLQSANEKLKEDIREKERNVEMRKTLIANVSHELKTPIALVMSYSEGLSNNDALDEEKKAYYLDVINKEADHMDSLVKDLLSLTELEYDAFKLQVKKFDLSSLLDEIIDRYATLIIDKGLKLKLEKEDIIEVCADKKRIEMALTNLLINAVEHANNDGVITVQVTENERTIIKIHNTGSSIPEEDIESIWTSFYKSEANKDRRIGGSGIGLSIVKAVVEKHHGQYKAVNEQDGVAFIIEI